MQQGEGGWSSADGSARAPAQVNDALDLSVVQQRLSQGEYKSAAPFVADVRAVLRDAAYCAAEGSELRRVTLALWGGFEKHVRKIELAEEVEIKPILVVRSVAEAAAAEEAAKAAAAAAEERKRDTGAPQAGAKANGSAGADADAGDALAPKGDAAASAANGEGDTAAAVGETAADTAVKPSANGAGSAGTNGGERTTIHLHTDPDTLRHDGEGAESRLDTGAHVSAETSRRLACDCAVVHWDEDKAGDPLNIGRRSRSIPPAIRRALQKRDQGCRFPGCTAHKHVDAHHIRHWADGGETKMDNLVLLCRHHHRLVHEGGYGVRMTGDSIPEFTDPTGRTMPTSAETRSRGNVFELITRNRNSGLEIGPETAIPLWEGERMDDGMAVEGLLQLE